MKTMVTDRQKEHLELLNLGRESCRWQTRNDASLDFDDLCQDAMEIIWRDREQIIEATNVKAYIRKIVARLARRHRTENMLFHAQYTYRVNDVAKLLEEYYTGRPARTDADIDNDHIDPIAVRADLETAIDVLTPEHDTILARRYYLGETVDACDRKKLQRAIQRVTELMNQYKGRQPPSGRRAVSNSAALARIRENQ